MPNRSKPTIAIIGAGRVGRALATNLRAQGYNIGAVVTRSHPTARAAVKKIGAGHPFAGLDKTILDADIILISTPDRSIPEIARQLAKLGKGTNHSSNDPWRNKTILHTCGALGGEVLGPLQQRGAHAGVLHPLQTFTKRSTPNLEGVAVAIDGNPAAAKIARQICKDLGAIPIRIPRNKKAAYHAAAVLAAGHVLTTVEAATQILMRLGFSRKKAVRALLPLTRQTLSNFERDGAPNSWTGPAARGDLQTVQHHLAALRKFPKQYRQAYAALTNLGLLLLSPKPRRAPV